ncbi:MAG: hypothetical protein QM783_17105 [Phycisphaerales bacterium]
MTRQLRIDQLCVTIGAENSVTAQGEYRGQPVSCAVADSNLVFLAFSGGASTRIGCFSNAGDRIWLVDISNDFVVNMRIEQGCLIAWTWDCWSLTFSTATGSLLAEQFTK